jgi:hypothetical protein
MSKHAFAYKFYIHFCLILFATCSNAFKGFVTSFIAEMGKGQNVKNQNVKSPKVDQKFEKDQNFKGQFRLSTIHDSRGVLSLYPPHLKKS